MDEYVKKLDETFPVRENILRRVIKHLDLPEDGHGLDAGCGLALQTIIIAEETGPESRITGLDISSSLLGAAASVIVDAGYAKQITLKQGSIENIPFEDNTFDWVISIDCACYAPMDKLMVVKELKRVVKPGGSINICFYSSQQLLPGYPDIETRLNTTASGLAPFKEGAKSEDHANRTSGWLRRTGLKVITAKTFTADFSAPLEDKIKAGLLSLIKMRWEPYKDELPTETIDKFRNLTDPESQENILEHQDYYGFITYTLFSGVV